MSEGMRGRAWGKWWYLHDRALGAVERSQHRFLEKPGKLHHSSHPDPSASHIKLSTTLRPFRSPISEPSMKPRRASGSWPQQLPPLLRLEK